MALDKQLARIEAKLDALLDDRGIDAASIGPTTKPNGATATRKLTPQEQDAINNAPKTPVEGNGPDANAARVDDATNAPVTPAAVPADAVGTVTVETQDPDGDVTVKNVPASEAKASTSKKR